MVKIAKFFLYLLFFIGMLLFFLPKENLFYLLEQELSQKEIFISHESIKERSFGLQLKHATISYEGIEAAAIKKTDVVFLLFYNEVTLNNIELSSLVSNYWPQKIALCKVNYSLLHPLLIKAVAKGLFGEIDAEYALDKGELKVLLRPSKLLLKNYRSSLRYFKKLKNGEYSYEKSL